MSSESLCYKLMDIIRVDEQIRQNFGMSGRQMLFNEHVSAGASTDVEMGDRIERNEETDLVNCVGASSVKDKEHRTHCTEAIEKARDVGSKIGRPTKYYIRKRQVRQKDRNCTQEIEKARDIGSKIKKPTQYYTRKRLARQKDRGGIPGYMKREEDEKSGMTCSKNVDKASNFAPGNKKLKENINRTQPVTGKSGDGTLENLHEDKVEEQVSVKTGCEVIQNRDGKLKTKQQDLTKLEQHEVRGKVKENGIREKKHKLTEKTQNEALKDDCERKSKQKDVSEHDVHESVMHSQVGKTPDASARRMKVMQTLALIAPSGSPYCKNCFSRY